MLARTIRIGNRRDPNSNRGAFNFPRNTKFLRHFEGQSAKIGSKAALSNECLSSNFHQLNDIEYCSGAVLLSYLRSGHSIP
jgi:hypothetical protein